MATLPRTRTDQIQVLHVDDDPEFTALTATFLTRGDTSFNVNTAATPAEALGHLEHSHVDCVVSDYDMPGMDGIQFLKAVRENHPDLPFILFTGKGSEEVASTAISAGVDDYLQKKGSPDQYDVLANRIQNLTTKYRTTAALHDRIRQQHLVADLGQYALWEHDLQAVFEKAVNDVATALDNEYAKVLAYRPDHHDLLLRAGTGWHDGLVGTAAVGAGLDSQAGYTLQSEHPVIVDDLRTEQRFSGPPLLIDHDVVSGISVIIGPPENPWGVLGTHTTDRKAFTEDDITFVQSIANVLATAIRRNEREGRFHAVFDESFDAMVIANDDGMYIDANPAACELFGLHREDLLGRTITDFAPDDYDFEAEWDEFQTTERERGTFPLIRPDGDRRLVEYAATADIIEGQHLSILRDITDREQSDARFRALSNDVLDTSRVGTFVLDDSFNVVWVNNAVEDYFNIDRDAILGADKRALIDEHVKHIFEEPETFAATVLATYDDNTYVEQFECHIQPADGREERWLEHWSQPIESGLYAGGRVEHYTDITNRKQSELEVETAKDRLELALQDAGVWDWNIDTGELYWSDELLGMLGLTNEEFEGTIDGFEKRLHPDDTDRIDAAIDDALDTGSPYRVEQRIQHANGDYRWFDVRGKTVKGNDTTSMIGVGFDITDRKADEHELQAERDRLDEFAGVVSHDLRTPLSVAQGHLALAKEDCESIHFDKIETALDRMTRITEDVLWLAREGRHIGSLDSVRLKPAIEVAWDMAANPATHSALRVADDGLASATIAADDDRLRQLLENLLRNAIEHAGEQVTVTVGMLPDGFYIEDDGPGIPESERAAVFTAGYSTSDDGTGFGLSIVKQIADAHGWDIHVSDASNGGARFEIKGIQFTN